MPLSTGLSGAGPSRRALTKSFVVFVLTTLGPPAVAAQAVKDTLRLSIREAVGRALEVSDEVRLAVARFDVTDAQMTTARATGLPQLRMNTTFTHAYENARAQAVGQVFNQPNTYGLNFNLSQTLFQGGRIGAATRASDRSRDAAQMDIDDARARMTVDVQRAYLNALYAQRVVALQDTNLALANERLAQVVQLETAGRAAPYDVLRARVERSNIEPLVIQARNERDVTLLELKRLVNVPLTQPIALASRIDAAAVRVAAGAVDTTGLPARASLRSTEFAVQVRREAITIARADYLPTVGVFVQSGFQAFPPPGFGLPDRRGSASEAFCAEPTPGRLCQNGGWFRDLSVGTTISWPLFDGFRTRGNLDVAKAQLRLAETELHQEQEAVEVEVSRGRAELTRARAVFDARQNNAAEAVEAFRLATLRHARGLTAQLEVSDAQAQMLAAQANEIRAVYDVYLATIEFARALGRPIPFPPEASPSVPSFR